MKFKLNTRAKTALRNFKKFLKGNRGLKRRKKSINKDEKKEKGKGLK